MCNIYDDLIVIEILVCDKNYGNFKTNYTPDVRMSYGPLITELGVPGGPLTLNSLMCRACTPGMFAETTMIDLT